jgi:hypothetical protein
MSREAPSLRTGFFMIRTISQGLASCSAKASRDRASCNYSSAVRFVHRVWTASGLCANFGT